LKIEKNFKDLEKTLRSYLGLKRHLIGVKLIKNGSNNLEKGSEPKMPMSFCHMLRLASINGDRFLYGLEHEKCPIAQSALGLRKFKYLRVTYETVPEKIRKVFISPLDGFRVAPDVVLAILTPKHMMDLALISHALNEKPLTVSFSGENACAEFFVKPYVNGEPNVSLLCNGAREVYSDYRDSEIIFGAPLDFFIQSSKLMKRLNKMGGSLCGCRTSDIPPMIVTEFEKIGFSKGSDYFFGKYGGRNVRVYLNKDEKGKLGFITIHLPIKTSSEKTAEELKRKLEGSLLRPYFISRRANWLDLTVKGSMNDLGIDLFEVSSLKAAIESFIEKVNVILNRVNSDQK